MKTSCFIFFLSLTSAFVFSQGGSWTWQKGESVLNQTGNFGLQGIPAASNTPPALYEAADWIDQQGNFWLFGGYNNVYGRYSDLWKFDPTANIWTWMKGPGIAQQSGVYGTEFVPEPENNPGERAFGIMSWTDLNNNLWLFAGSDGGGEADYDDLWEYNIGTNEWTWMGGSQQMGLSASYGVMGVASDTNFPGCRAECTSAWTDANNNLWFFGGFQSNGSWNNDMWKYNISTNQWTWMSGSQNGSSYSYGTRGVESSSNVPPPRISYISWQDSAGNLYIYGGLGNNGPYSDVWRFNIKNNYWTWIAGANTTDFEGDYGDYCSDDTIGPRARYENRSPRSMACMHTFLSFGGAYGPDYSDNNVMNDLWSFNVQTNHWRWLSGPAAVNQPGSYGTQGVASTSNLPPPRVGQCSWLDVNGNYWIYGGGGDDIQMFYNDLWEFVPNSSCAIIEGVARSFHIASNTICTGDSTQISLSGYSNPQIFPVASVHWIDSSHATLLPDSTTTFIITDQGNCMGADTTRLTIYVQTPGISTYELSDGQLCEGGYAYLSLLGLNADTITPSANVVWQDSAHAILSPDTTTTYQLISQSSVCNSRDTASFTIAVAPYGPVQVSFSDSVLCLTGRDTVNVSGLTQVAILPNDLVGWIVTDQQAALRMQGVMSVTTFTLVGYTSCGSRYTQQFDVYPLTNMIPFTLTSSLICAGDSTLFQAQVSNNDSVNLTPGTNVNWLNPTVAWLSPSVTTTYVLTYTPSQCAQNNFTVEVIPHGSVLLSFSDTGSCRPVDTPAVVTVSGTNSFKVIPSASSVSGNNIYLRPDTTTAYTLIANSSCGGTDTMHFTINASAVPKYALSQNNICPGDTTILTLTGFSNTQITPLTGVSWIDSLHLLLYPDTTTTYTLSSDGSCVGHYNTTVTINIISSSSFTNASDSLLCYGDSVYVTVSYLRNPEITPYVNLIRVDSTDYYAYITVTQDVEYTLTGQSICSGLPVTRNFNLAPLANSFNITATKTSICANDSTRLCAPSGFSGYSWNTGATTSCIYAREAGDYYLAVSQNGRCAATSNNIQISVYPVPSVAIVVNGDTLSSFGAVTYQWLLDGAPINGATAATYIANEGGTYSLQITDTNGCTALSSTVAVTGVSKITYDNISVFPNPSTGAWELIVDNDMVGSDAEIFDAEGRLVYTMLIRNPRSEISFNAANGIYTLRISGEGFIVVKKLVKL